MADTTSTVTQSVDVPQWFKDEYLTGPKGLLALAQAEYGAGKDLDIYPDQRLVASEDPAFQALQSAWDAAQQMGTDPATAQAAAMAGAAGMNAGQLSYNPYTGSFTQAGTAAQYMSPYMQQVVDIEKREAARQGDIQRNVNQAQAVGQGAYGGSRQAIVEAERQRNLAQQMGDIQNRGLQAAYQQAQQQYNTEQQLGEQSRQYGAGLGLQGLQTQAQAAGQLGQIGQQGFGQQMDINKLQQQYGTQQLGLKQQELDLNYQDFLNQQNYPMQQLTNYANILAQPMRGVGTTSTQTVAPAPSFGSQLLGLGTAAYGISNLLGKKQGGVVNYAKGGFVDAAGLPDLLISRMG